MHGICKLRPSLKQHNTNVTYRVICDIMIMSLVPLLCVWFGNSQLDWLKVILNEVYIFQIVGHAYIDK